MSFDLDKRTQELMREFMLTPMNTGAANGLRVAMGQLAREAMDARAEEIAQRIEDGRCTHTAPIWCEVCRVRTSHAFIARCFISQPTKPKTREAASSRSRRSRRRARRCWRRR